MSWPGDWVAIHDPAARSRLEAELALELGPGHRLAGQAVRLLGRRLDQDDFLFELGDGRVAQVHLTWRVETRPEWPWTEVFASFDHWRRVPDEDR